MIEFKRAGDVMVFECPAFRVEVSASGAELVAVNPDRRIAGSDEMMQLLTDAFKILDMMIEHKARQTHVLHFGVDVAKGEDASDAIRKLNEYVWKRAPSENLPGHRFREFMKREGL